MLGYVAWSGGLAVTLLLAWYGIQDALPHTPPNQTRVITAEKKIVWPGDELVAGEMYWVFATTTATSTIYELVE